MAMVIILTLTIAFFVKLICLISVLAYSRLILPKHVLLTSLLSVRRLFLTENGKWGIETGLGKQVVTIRGDSTLTGIVSVLRFEVGKKIGSCVIFKDAVKGDEYRKLLVLLRTNNALKAQLKRRNSGGHPGASS